MHMDHKFSEIDHVTPLFNFFLVVHLPTHSALTSSLLISLQQKHCEQVHSIRAICTTIIIADAMDLLQADPLLGKVK